MSKSAINDNVVILHITAPGDQLGAGIADYCDKLVTAQRKQGIEAYYVFSNSIANHGKLNDQRYIPVQPWSDNHEQNQKAL